MFFVGSGITYLSNIYYLFALLDRDLRIFIDVLEMFSVFLRISRER